MKIEELAQAAHEAYQSAPTVADRWPSVARAILQKLNDRPEAHAINAVYTDGEIRELVPPATKATPPEDTEDLL